MSEKQPQQPSQQQPEQPPWDPAEQVGDIYAAEINEQGHIESAERLQPQTGDDEPPRAERQPEQRPQIWIGSWLDYNNGLLYGQWIDAARDDAEIWADISAMLAHSPTAAQTGEVAEDWGIFDYDNFGSLRIGEQETVSWVAKVARGIAEHGLAYAAYADVMEEEEALDGFTDAYLGHYDSVEAYVEQLADDLGYERLLDEAVPENLRPYVQINVAAMARDMHYGGDVHVIAAEDGGVWLFDARQ